MVPVIFLCLWFFLASVADAATYYVATNGNNSNDGLSIDTPKLTIAHCVSIMVAGDTCQVRGGTYAESGGVRFAVSGTQAAPIKLLNYPGEKPIISFPSKTSSNRILIQHASGSNVAIGWITIEGFEIRNGWEGIKFSCMHNSVIRRNWIHDGRNSGILGTGGHHNTFEYNIINHQGDFEGCAAGTALCNQQHGFYMHGDSYILRNNVVYDNIGVGIQQNGSSTSTYSTARHPSPEFAGASNWIITDNTLAYSRYGPGIIIWGNNSNNIRVENNICYENQVESGTSSGQCVFFTSVSAAVNVLIRNNHSFASGSGGQPLIGGSATEGVQYTLSGNVVNVSPPAFVNGGSNALPVSPDFRLTASAPVNICRTNEFPNNSTCVVGAFKTVANPSCSITANVITCIFPMSTAVPIQSLSTAGVSVGCTGSACPGSPTVNAVTAEPNTDTHVLIPIAGIAGDACVSLNQNWTITYASVPGSWMTNDYVGPYPGLHNDIFSFTNLAVTNQCTGGGPASYPAGYHIFIPFDDGTGTVANDQSVNNLDCTLTNGAGWGTGNKGTALTVASGTTQYCALAWGNGVNPSTQSLTIFIPIFIEAGAENATHYVGGPDLGTSQRAYVCGHNGTWKVSIQATSCQSTAASNLSVTAGWNLLTLQFNSTTDIATLYKGTLIGTGGASVSYTSFTFASDWKIGRLGVNNATGNYSYDDFLVYLSIQNPADLVAAFNAPASTPGGTLAQAAVQVQGVFYDTSGNPIIFTTPNNRMDVVDGGGAVLLFQIHCENVSDCDQTAFKLVYRKNGSLTNIQVPNTQTSDGTWMWGPDTSSSLNAGTRSTRLTGSCTLTNGSTQLTADQIPSVDLPQDGCVVLAYIVRVDATPGDYFEYKLLTESGSALSGGYDAEVRVDVVNPRGSAGF